MGQTNDVGEMLDKMNDIARKYQTFLSGDLLKTTYLGSYQVSDYKPAPVKITDHAKERQPKSDFVHIKNLHTLTPYKKPNIPFNLFHKPDPITRRHPRQMQEPCDLPKDLDHEKIMKSRPKVVMTPAHDLDRIEEPCRKMIVDDMYLSETAKSFNERVALVNAIVVKAPLPNCYSKAKPITLKRLTEPYVSPEWRMDSVTWDTKQLRTIVDPTKKFWLSRDKSEYDGPSSQLKFWPNFHLQLE